MADKTNIVLLGFMGSGKTGIGRQAARLLDFDFADTDEEIREVTGMELSKLYKKHGEIRCRSEEKLLISKLAQRDNMVIACGGSLPPERRGDVWSASGGGESGGRLPEHDGVYPHQARPAHQQDGDRGGAAGQPPRNLLLV